MVVQTLFLLLAGHALADYPLQGDFIARGKNFRSPIAGIDWWVVMLAHSLIHGGAVVVVTGNVWMGVVETVLHFLIDHAKCRNYFGFKTDQALHVVCKIGYFAVLCAAGGQ